VERLGACVVIRFEESRRLGFKLFGVHVIVFESIHDCNNIRRLSQRHYEGGTGAAAPVPVAGVPDEPPACDGKNSGIYPFTPPTQSAVVRCYVYEIKGRGALTTPNAKTDMPTER